MNFENNESWDADVRLRKKSKEALSALFTILEPTGWSSKDI
jgi:hypothetical protein